MSQRQYIGARYVPKIEGEWNVNKAYEALTVVTHLNSSYTSKKPVAPGIDITNSEYWVLTGNYNGQVEEYRKEAEAALNGVNTINGKLANYDEFVTLEDLGGSYEADDNSSALNSLPSGKCLLLTGNCKIKSAVNLADNTSIIGSTKNAILTIDADFTVGAGCHISNLSTQQTRTIYLAKNGCFLSSVYLRGSVVLLVVRGSLHKIMGCNFETTNTNIHLKFEKVSGILNINTTVCGCMFAGSGTSLEMVGGSDGQVEGVSFVGNTIMSTSKYPILLNKCYGIILTGNVIDQYEDRGVVIFESNYVNISGNWMGSNTTIYGGALQIDNLSSEIVFNGNNIVAAVKNSYVCLGTGRSVTITNNSCVGSEMTLFKCELENANIICTGNRCFRAFDPLTVTVKGIVANNVLSQDPGSTTNGLTVVNNVF